MGSARRKRALVAALVAVSAGVSTLVAAGPQALAVRRVVVVPPRYPGGPSRVVVTPGGVRVYRGRIVVALRRRKVVFDAASARLTARLTVVENIAADVKAAGGDVSKVNDLIDSARSMIDQAKATEAKAVDALEAVPSASDKWTAFQSARALGRQAVTELIQARDYGRQAVAELRRVVNQLVAEGGGSQ